MKITHFFEIEISETSRSSLKEEPSYFNKIIDHVDTIEEVKAFLFNRYGKIPSMKRKVMTDTKQGPMVVGFLYSFWNQDISHASKKWFQTDWIIIKEIKQESRPVLFAKTSKP